MLTALSMGELDGQVAFVTGAGSGIGREIAGARVLGDLVTMVSEKLAAAGRA